MRALERNGAVRRVELEGEPSGTAAARSASRASAIAEGVDAHALLADAAEIDIGG